MRSVIGISMAMAHAMAFFFLVRAFPHPTPVSMNHFRHHQHCSLINSDVQTEDPLDILPTLYTYQKPRQKRTPQTTLNRPRKPRYFWHDENNIRKELCLFWEELDVPIHKINPNQPPPIPSEYLLNYFNRNDLRWGIAQMGGRENVSHLLGGAKIIPGKWKEAKELEELKFLLPRMEEYFKIDLKRKSINKRSKERIINTQQSKHGGQQQEKEMNVEPFMYKNTTLFSLVSSHNPENATRMQTNEFWSKEKVVKDLYRYLDSYRKYKDRPACWMPQFAELKHEGYSRLFNACSRFKKLPCVSKFMQNEDESIESVAGLVPFREWRFFESQLQLFVELQYYLQLYHNGSEDFFPEPPDVLMHGHSHLHELIRIHGGKTLLAQKLDMSFIWDVQNADSNNASAVNSVNQNPNSLSWGSFSLNFAIQLLHFIRSQYMSMSPPLSISQISMPTEKDLVHCGHDDLANQVMKYGGYESVARRLGLAYFDGKSQRMDEKRYKGAKLLWKHRHSKGVLSGSSTRLQEENTGRKSRGIAWNEDLVIKELHAYVNVNMTIRSLPTNVMPRFPQLEEDGRGDLKRAISKFGGKKYIAKKAGLITMEDWQKAIAKQ